MTKLIAAAAILAIASGASATLLFDNITNQQAAGGLASTSSTPNTFMGGGYNLIAGATKITGFDIYPVNTTGTNFNAIRINIWVWGTVNMGTVNAGSPAFSNLLGQYTLTTTGTFTTGFYYPFEGVPIGVNPGITLGTPLSIPNTTIGMTFNYQGSTNGGATYSNINNLTSLITGNAANAVGTNVFNGYYRNAAGETNGNFTSTLRSLGNLTNQSVGVRIYGDIPAPGSLALVGLGGLIAGRRRR